MNFGVTFEKLLLFGVIAALLIGPARLPMYAEGLARLVKRGREFMRGAKTRMKEEMGSDEEVDWRKLDPRQYDPRRIIRDALFEDAPSAAPAAAAAAIRSPLGDAPRPSSAPAAATRQRPVFDGENPPPFDLEAT